MQIKCSHCAKILTVPDGTQAAEGKCPHCNQMVDLQNAERIGLAAGDVLGDFRVDQLIGKGGMATVYRGVQVSLDRPVAIKLLAPQLARRPKFVERFQREAKLLAQLSHHNIVGVLAVGTRDDDTYYLVMEYVEGESLRDRLRRDGTIPFEDAANIIDQVAAGLEYAHNHQVLHRDIKPANILITGDGVPKIADFGIARMLGADTAAQQRLTIAQTQMGSAHYMAPEQMKDAASADHRADIYALGVMFYEMLTGELPIGQFKPPSKIAQGVPVAADRIIRQALAQSPDERFQTVAQFRALVQRLTLTGAPTRIQEGRPRTDPQPRAAVPHHHHKKKSPLPMLLGAAGVVAAAIVIALLTLGGGKTKTQAKQPPPSPPVGGVSVPRVLSEKEKREQHAKTLFNTAFKRFQLGRTSSAASYLARLDKECADADYYAANRAAIAKFRRDLAAKLALPPTPPAKKAVAPPPPKKAVEPPPEPAANWVSLFDGKTLDGWRPVREFAVNPAWGPTKGGTVAVKDGQVVLDAGDGLAGVVWSGDFPTTDYEISVEAMRLAGKGSLSYLVFPIGNQQCSFAVGTHDGKVVGLDKMDGVSDNLNRAAIRMPFQDRRWYALRLRVTQDRVRAWIDDKNVFDVPTEGHTFSTWGAVSSCKPLALTCVKSQATFRNIRLRRLGEAVAAGPRFFHADVKLLPDGRVELRYDWSRQEQLRDWTPEHTGPPGIVNGQVVLSGHRAGLAHRAMFRGAAEVAGTCCLRQPRGAEASAVVTLWDPAARKGYGFVIRGGNQKLWKNSGLDVIGWGEVACPNAVPHTFRMARSDDGVEGWIDGVRQIQSRDHEHRYGGVGLTVWNAEVAYSDIRIIGTLDPAWLAAHPDAKKQIDALRAGAPPAPAANWVSLFDGKTLRGWQPINEFPTAGRGGTVTVVNGRIVLAAETRRAGAAYAGDFPRTDYEIEAEVTLTEGGENVCGMVVPLGEQACFLWIGWPGPGVALSSVDGKWPPTNPTFTRVPLKAGQLHKVRLRVAEGVAALFMDDHPAFKVEVAKHRFAVSKYLAPLKTFGLYANGPKATFRNIRLRRLGEAAAPPPPQPAGPLAVYARGVEALKPLWQKRLYAEALVKAKQLAAEDDLKAAPAAAKALVEDAEALAGFWAAVEAGAAKLKQGTPFRIRGMMGAIIKVEDGTIHVKVGGAEIGQKLSDLKDAELIVLAKKTRPLTEPKDLLALALIELHAKKPDKAKAEAALLLAAKAGIDTSLRQALLKGSGPKLLPPVAWGELFGAVDRKVQRIDPGTGHLSQVWRILTEHPPSTSYRVRIQHAAPGDKGAFRIWAWADDNGDGVPDTKIGTSTALRAKRAGDWSTWEFQTSHTRVFVGNWYASGTVIYYQTGRALYSGLDGTLYYSGTVGGAPTSKSRGSRFTNMQVQVKLPPDKRAQAEDEPPPDGRWQSLFDGKSLRGWKPAAGDAIAGREKIAVQGGAVVLKASRDYTGVAFAGRVPRTNYEVALEAMRVEGGRDFCDLSFPIGNSGCALILGGGPRGDTVALSVFEAVTPEPGALTGKQMAFERARWYALRVRVTDERVAAWLDEEKVIDVPRAGSKFTVHPHLAPMGALGVAAFRTKAALRNIRVRRLAPEAEPLGEAPKPGEWQSLFDGKSLRGWRVAEEFPGAGKGGEVRVAQGRILLARGERHTGLSWAGAAPTMGYELAFEAMRSAADQPCLCHVVYPFRDGHGALLLGAKGDALHLGAAKQPSKRAQFQPRRWYSVRLCVTESRIQLWIDGKPVLDGESLARAPEFWAPWSPIKPLGFFTTHMTTSLRNIRLRRLGEGG